MSYAAMRRGKKKTRTPAWLSWIIAHRPGHTLREIRGLVSRLIELQSPGSAVGLFNRLRERATERTLDYIETNMAHAVVYVKPDRFFLDSARLSRPGSVMLEFGVFTGRSIKALSAGFPDRRIIGFDSFEGLPEDWAGFAKTNFDLAGRAPSVPGNVELVVGRFEDTLSGWVAGFEGDVGFIHIDCDIYSSTKTVFDTIHPLLGHGVIIVFDEYFNYPGFENHEMKAFREFIEASEFSYEYVSFCGERVCVRLFEE